MEIFSGLWKKFLEAILSHKLLKPPKCILYSYSFIRRGKLEVCVSLINIYNLFTYLSLYIPLYISLYPSS